MKNKMATSFVLLAAISSLFLQLCLAQTESTTTSERQEPCILNCTCTTLSGEDSASSDSVLQIDCSRKGLETASKILLLLQTLPRRIELDLSYNNIREIKLGDFDLPPFENSNLTEIETIDLRRNKIRRVEDKAFSRESIKGLQYLFLSDNQIEVFHEFTFDSQVFDLLDISHNHLRSFPYAFKRSRPQRLKLNNNPIGNLPDDAFMEVKNVYEVMSIRELDLSALGMTIFDSCALNVNKTLLALQVLYLDENHFETVTRSFFPCMVKSLATLSMRQCHTRVYERDAFSSDGYIDNTLLRLHLSGNNLTVLQRRGFRYLDDLIELDLSNCGITNILRNAFVNVSIRGTLDLSYNNITEIHDRDFYNITKLQHLVLSHSNIHRISGRPFENLTELESIDLSYNNLTVINGSEFMNIHSLETLDLSHSNIQVLDRRPFRTLEHLISLDLTYNNLTVIASQVFYRLTHLTDLRLMHSNIQMLSNKSFVTLDSLEDLDLSYNNISEIGDDVFTGLINVKMLYLTHSFILNFTGHPFEKMPKLEYLFLDENLLTVETFVRALRGMKYIHTLDLSHNMLTKIPNLSVEDFPDLSNLWLGFNNIRTIKRDDLKNMSFIRELVLKDNNVSEIEYDAFAECPNITLLNLDGSWLPTLPDLQYMTQLRTLHLNRGILTALPEDLCQNHRFLTILEVKNNSLTYLPSFRNCTRLTIGVFAENFIGALEDDTFPDQRFLRHLDLENNLITDLPDSLLTNAVNMEVLRVANNRLTSLSPQMFENLPNLITLNASHNRIQSLDEDLFKNNTNMDFLYLNDNEIAIIDDHAFPEFSELRRIDLSDNPFSSWQLPSSGFIYLAHLALKNVPNLFHVPGKHQIPRAIDLEFTYPYHCCIWRDFAYELELQDEENFNNSGLPPTMIPTSEDPTLPPGWESCPPDKLAWIEAVRRTWNYTVVFYPDCKVEFLEAGTTVEISMGEEEAVQPQIEDAFSSSLRSRFDEEIGVDFTRQVLCRPFPDALNPCDNLMDPMFLRVAIWAIWVVALLGNGTVLFVAIGALEKLETYQFIICNLAIADFFMGIYLAFLAIVDIRTFGSESFYQSALSWQFGPGCKTAGFIAVFSSELSMYMLVLLTVERVYTISYGFNQTEKSKMKIAAIFVVIGWIFALFLATLPLVGINSYTKVAVCLPYMTRNWYDRAYIGFLISVNLLGFLVILGSYCYIFYRIRKSPAQPPTKKGTIATAAMKIAVLIVSALVCWAPIAVIGYAALAGTSLVSVYQAKFFIVFVYPFNACINPFIYAIFTRHFRHKLGSMFKRTKDKVTSFPQNLRLQHRTSAFLTDNSGGRVNSPRGHPTSEDLRRLRQSKRSNSYCLHYVDHTSPAAVVQSPSPSTRISPPAGVYMGRRSSLPAAFGSTLGGSTSSRPPVATNVGVYPPLPFQLGPLYSSENSSLPNLPEEGEMKDVAMPAHIEVDRATLGGSQDSSLRRLSIVEEEEEVDETDFSSKGAKLDSVSVSSSDSEDYIDASEHPIDVVVIEKCTDLDKAAAILSHREEKVRRKRIKTSQGDSQTLRTDCDRSTSCEHKAQKSSKRTSSTSSLHDVVVEDLTESSELELESLERRTRAERGASKLSTDSACSGYISSAMDDATLMAFTPEGGARLSSESRDSSAQRSTSPEEIRSDESKDCHRKMSSTSFEEARSQPTLGDTTSVDSGSCHDMESTGNDAKGHSNYNSYLTSSKRDSNSNTQFHSTSSSSSVDQESVHSALSHSHSSPVHRAPSHSHSSKFHAQTGFSNLTFDLQPTGDETQTGTSSVSHSTASLGITKSETEV